MPRNLDKLSTEWMSEGICRKVKLSTTRFFEDFLKGSYTDQQAIVSYCNTCPVKMDCRDYAKRTGQSGLWGGIWFEDGRPRPSRMKKIA